MARALGAQVGRRGGTLLFLALLDVAVALGILTVEPERIHEGAYAGARAVAPLPCWSVVWLIVAAVCFVQAFQKRDVAAFTFAATIKAVWALTYIGAQIALGTPRAWVSAAVWLGFSGLVLLISGWEENRSASSGVTVVNLGFPGGAGDSPGDGVPELQASDEGDEGDRR